MRRFFIAAALAAASLCVLGVASAFAGTRWVDDTATVGGNTSCADPGYNTINAAIGAASTGDVIRVCAGTYNENVVLDKDVAVRGAQAGNDARTTRSGGESTVTGSGTLLELRTGVAGATVDGFTFQGGSRAIESTTGPIDRVELDNNRIMGFTDSGIFLNDNGARVSIVQNVIDGSSSTSTGGLLHLDQDSFDGIWILRNYVVNGAANSGLFSDGNRNVGTSGPRRPMLVGNVFDRDDVGANIGRKSFEFADISGNGFTNNDFDGLQGGPADSTITGNAFIANGRSGLALTGFGGGTDATRGAQRNTIEENTFSGNGREGIFFTATQAAGTISTNVANHNNITGNAVGATYTGTETVNVECNWWGHYSGPSGDGPGSGDSVAGTGLDYTPWLTSPAPGGDCNGPLGARGLKQKVVESLSALLPTGDQKDDEHINKAIEHLNKSLGLAWYGDAPADKKVFDEEKKAVDELGKVKNTDVSTDIDQIVEIDRKMAQDAIDYVTAHDGDQKEIDKANAEMGKAQDELDKGRSANAIDHYKKAWQHAVKALGIDMGDPDAV